MQQYLLPKNNNPFPLLPTITVQHAFTQSTVALQYNTQYFIFQINYSTLRPMDSQLHLDSHRTYLSIQQANNELQEQPQAPRNHPPTLSRSSTINYLLLAAVALLGGWLLALLWERAQQQLRTDLESALRTELKDTSDRLELAQLTQLATLKKMAETQSAKYHHLQQKLDKEVKQLEEAQKKSAQQGEREKQENQYHDKILNDLKIEKQKGEKTMSELNKERQQREKAIGELKKENEDSKRIISQLRKEQEERKKKLTAPTGKPMKAGYVSKGAKGAPANIENPQIVIDIDYPEKDYLPLPIDFFRKNSLGKTLADVLYYDEQRKQREQFHKERIAFLNGRKYAQQLYLTKYNMPLNEAAEKEAIEDNVKEWMRLNSTFGFNSIKKELPMCIMVPGYNNNANFRIEYNLNSIFIQNYTNYKVVIIDDMSNDGSETTYRNYLVFHRIDKSRYVYIQNNKRVTALQNIYLASLNHCGQDSIVMTIDADDQFIGRNVLQVFNAAYQNLKAGVLYSNFWWYEHKKTTNQGFTWEYSEDVKKNNLYRDTKMQFSHLRSYRNEILAQINPKDLQDDKGEFFRITYDLALFLPLMEMSCGRVWKINGEFHYLYNTGTGLNDYNDRGRQIQVERKIRAMKKYTCYKDFDKRMSQ